MSREGKLIGASIFMGISYAYLLMGKEKGISFTIFCVLLLGFLLFCLKTFNKNLKNKILFFAIPMILLAFHFMFTSNTFFLFIDHKIILILFVSISIILIKNVSYDWGIPSFLSDIFIETIKPFEYFLAPYKVIKEKLKNKKIFSINENTKKILIGIMISLPTLLIVIALLSSADMVFKQIIDYIPELLNQYCKDFDVFSIISKVIGGLLVANYLYSYILNLLITKQIKSTTNLTLTNQNKLDSVIAITLLTIMNLYQENYGYTYLRLFVYFFLLLETILLFITLLHIIKPKFHLEKAFVIISLTLYIGFSYSNIDNFIAKKYRLIF